MNNNSLKELINKEYKFKKMERVLHDIENTILSFSEDKQISIKITVVAEEGGILYIDLFDRLIKVLFENNLDKGFVHFFLGKVNANSSNLDFEKLVTIESDDLGNVECEELNFSKQLFHDVHYDVLNFIIKKSCECEIE